MCVLLQAELKKKYSEEQLPNFLATFEKVLKENKGGNGYFVGDEVSYIQQLISFKLRVVCVPKNGCFVFYTSLG